MRKRKGFTLLEIVVCLGIAAVGIMAAASIFNIFGNMAQTRTEIVHRNISQQASILSGIVRNKKLTEAGPTSFKANGVVVAFNEGTVTVGTDILIDGVKDMRCKYFDFKNDETTKPEEAKTVKIEIDIDTQTKKISLPVNP